MSTVHLVLIEKYNTYTFYAGKKKIVKVQSKQPMPREYLELYRVNHIELIHDIYGGEPPTTSA
jgi:hypothetical protein